MKHVIQKLALAVLIAMIFVLLFTTFAYAESMNETVSKIVSDSGKFENAGKIEYCYDNGVLSVFSIKSIDIGNEPSDYIDCCVKVKISEDGVMNYLPEVNAPNLSYEQARALIGIRLWLFKVDLYDNTSILNFTKTPIKFEDEEYIDWYPLLDDFSTKTKFTDYLKTVFTDGIASSYLDNDTTIRVYGNELYDIGGKVAQFSFDSENYAVEEVFTSDNGAWHQYRVSVKFDSYMGDDLENTYDDFYVGIFYTENGWRIAQTTFKNESELLYLETYTKKATEKNPSTSDFSIFFPLVLSISLTGTLISLKKGKRS